MQYFKEELRMITLFEDTEENKRQREQEDLAWMEANRTYNARFQQVSARLTKSVVNFYSSKSLHDRRLLSIHVEEGNHAKSGYVTVILRVMNWREVVEITYKKVSKCYVDFNKGISRGFGDIVLEEILDVDEKTMSHEMICSSDATIVIHFQNKGMSMKRV